MYSLVPAAPAHVDFSNVPVPATATFRHCAEAAVAPTALTASAAHTASRLIMSVLIRIVGCSLCCGVIAGAGRHPSGRPTDRRSLLADCASNRLCHASYSLCERFFAPLGDERQGCATLRRQVFSASDRDQRDHGCSPCRRRAPAVEVHPSL